MRLETASPPVFGKENCMEKLKRGLRVKGLTFKFNNCSHSFLEDVNLEVDEPGVYILTGKSGCGKSTLLHLLTGIIPWVRKGEVSGEICVAGCNPISQPLPIVSKRISVLLQSAETQLFSSFVDEELSSQLTYASNNGFSEFIDRLGINELRGRRISTLSAGEKRKVALLSAILSPQRIVFLDEPFINIDTDSRRLFTAILDRLKDSKIFLITTHEITNELKDIVKGVAHISNGKLRYSEGTALLDDPEVRKYVRVKPYSIRFRKNNSNGTVPLIKLERISFGYNSKPVLKDLSLEIYSGTITGLYGRNGSGKTTLARIIAGLLKPYGGKIRGKAKVGLIFQDPYRQLIYSKVEDEIAFSIGKRDSEKILRYLRKAGLDDKANRDVLSLSYGELERLAITAVLATEPDLLILDEPEHGLDFPNLVKLCRMLEEEREKGRAILVISHDLEFLRLVSDRSFSLEGGMIREG